MTLGWSVLLLAIAVCAPLARAASSAWVAHIPGGMAVARQVARDTGAALVGHLGNSSNLFAFEQPDSPAWWPLQSALERHPHVANATMKIGRTRARRMVFMDPKWEDQWYLQPDFEWSLRTMKVWSNGTVGSGVVITVVDDGLEYTNPDIAPNYDPAASYDFNDNDADPLPRYDDTDLNKHGTRCAGTAAAATNNFCGVGVAYGASIGGIRILDAEGVSDEIEGKSLSFKPQHIDIYSCSWGPLDDGETVEGPGPAARRAFRNGVQNGRDGRGSVYVWAAGNGGANDNCNMDGYANSVYTIAISSVDRMGTAPEFSERCSAIMAAAFSGGGAGPQVTTSDWHQTCTGEFSGTSASAPMAAGVIALVLQANPCLSWRDVQQLIVETADNTNLNHGTNTGWLVNGAGHHVSDVYGFGLLRADRLVEAAKKAIPMPGQVVVQVPLSRAGQMATPSGQVQLTLGTTGCSPGGICITSVEQVELSLTITGVERSALVIGLVSPRGTYSPVMTRRPNDLGLGLSWTFTTVMCWGENPAGEWLLIVNNYAYVAATIVEWGLVLYGTASPVTYQKGKLVSSIRPPDHTCSYCQKNSFPDGLGGCRQCDVSCRDGCVAAGQSGCRENFEQLELYNHDDPIYWTRQRIVMTSLGGFLVAVLLFYGIGHAVCKARHPTLRNAEYSALTQDPDAMEDGEVVMLDELDGAAPPGPAAARPAEAANEWL